MQIKFGHVYHLSGIAADNRGFQQRLIQAFSDNDIPVTMVTTDLHEGASFNFLVTGAELQELNGLHLQLAKKTGMISRSDFDRQTIIDLGTQYQASVKRMTSIHNWDKFHITLDKDKGIHALFNHDDPRYQGNEELTRVFGKNLDQKI